MHQTTILKKGQRFLMLVLVSALVTFTALPAYAGMPAMASIQFVLVVNGDPSARVQFEISYWDASTSLSCDDYGAITQVVLNNHQRAQTRELQPASYCLSHTIFSEDTGSYSPGQIDCLSLDGQKRFDFDAGAVAIAAGDRIRCTMSVNITG